VTSPISAGCHRLIREYQAECVTNAAQMAELVGGGGASEGQPPLFDAATEPTSDQIRVTDALSRRSPRTITEIAARSGMSPVAVRGALGALELDGAVTERPDGWVRVSRVSSRTR
jgi:DNA processing protein